MEGGGGLDRTTITNNQDLLPTHQPFIRLGACACVGWWTCEHCASSCDRGHPELLNPAPAIILVSTKPGGRLLGFVDGWATRHLISAGGNKLRGMSLPGEDGLWGCSAQKGLEGQSSGDMLNHVKQVPFSPTVPGRRQPCVSEAGKLNGPHHNRAV